MTIFGSPAEAGGKGKRLQFGGHLGSFVARPTNGHVSKRSHRAAKIAAIRRAKIARIRKAKIAAARKAKIAEIRKAKIAAARKAKIAAGKRARIAAMKKKAAIAKKRRIAALNRAAKRRAKAQAAREQQAREQDENEVIIQDAEVAGVEETTPATKQQEEQVDGSQETVEAELPEIIVEGDGEGTNVADASSVAPSKQDEAENRDITCKKFVPSAGMTITVPCQD